MVYNEERWLGEYDIHRRVRNTGKQLILSEIEKSDCGTRIRVINKERKYNKRYERQENCG